MKHACIHAPLACEYIYRTGSPCIYIVVLLNWDARFFLSGRTADGKHYLINGVSPFSTYNSIIFLYFSYFYVHSRYMLVQCFLFPAVGSSDPTLIQRLRGPLPRHPGHLSAPSTSPTNRLPRIAHVDVSEHPRPSDPGSTAHPASPIWPSRLSLDSGTFRPGDEANATSPLLFFSSFDFDFSNSPEHDADEKESRRLRIRRRRHRRRRRDVLPGRVSLPQSPPDLFLLVSDAASQITRGWPGLGGITGGARAKFIVSIAD